MAYCIKVVKMRTRSSDVYEKDIDIFDESAIEQLLSQAKSNIQKASGVTPVDEVEQIRKTWQSIPKLDDSSNSAKKISKKGPVKLVEFGATADKSSSNSGLRKVVDPIAVKRDLKAQRESTAGSKWFNMPKAELTPELKRDLQLLKLRNVLDPKRHYKKDNTPTSKYLQTGTIIEGNTEFYSARLSNKERKRTIAEEILADSTARAYYKKKFGEIQSTKRSGRKGDWKKRMEARKKF